MEEYNVTNEALKARENMMNHCFFILSMCIIFACGAMVLWLANGL